MFSVEGRRLWMSALTLQRRRTHEGSSQGKCRLWMSKLVLYLFLHSAVANDFRRWQFLCHPQCSIPTVRSIFTCWISFTYGLICVPKHGNGEGEAVMGTLTLLSLENVPPAILPLNYLCFCVCACISISKQESLLEKSVWGQQDKTDVDLNPWGTKVYIWQQKFPLHYNLHSK